ncbi:MAG: acetate--CoA ligase family protein [Candidatus Acetothermia bacterium]|jgi:acetyltransferase|nr:acetate--CoA ligase family protein [Candidatus Acetothermia bacterium]MDH7505796.1 acetate--CoA ligase family protein [Candidatus Acetothermia bacterium]
MADRKETLQRAAVKQPGLASLFNPQALAVIGASANPEKVGYKVMYNLVQNGFPNRLYPINPHTAEILGYRCYRSVLEVPEELDLAIIAVPAPIVPQVMEECGRRGTRFLVILASGFAEVGRIAEERELVEITRRYGMRFLGPNIFGIYYAPTKMNATFGPTEILPGKIALITQSGALGIALTGKTIMEEIGLVAIASVGNKADLDEVELLEFFAADPQARTIIIYLEGTRRGRELLQLARQVVREKPIIAIKAGRSQKGARAAASHTGALAGSDAVFSAGFEQAGILRAPDPDEAFNWARALASQPLPAGRNTVIITNGGGVGVLATDAAEEQGIYLLDDLPLLERLFREAAPEFGSLKNPIDLTGMATPNEYRLALRGALEEERLHAIIILYCMGAEQIPRDFAQAIIEEYDGTKPLVVAMLGGAETVEAVKLLNRAGIAAYDEPEEAVRALAALYRWKDYRDRPLPRGEPELEVDWAGIEAVLKGAWTEGRLQFLEPEVKEILQLLGLEVPEYRVAHSLKEALQAGEELGYPLVLKIISEQILHKTEAGGIRLNLRGERDLRGAYQEMLAAVGRSYPRAPLRGVLVTKFITGGVEAIVGASRDPSFGPTVMFGLGGIYVEVLKDVVFRVAPLSHQEAREMIGKIRSAALLRGIRGELRKDIEALAEALYRIAALVARFPEISELDINPLRVMPEGEGCLVLDARMTISEVR